MVAVRVGYAGVFLDGGLIPRPLSIIHGRSEVGTQPDPPSMEFEWWDDTPPPGVGGDPLTLGELVQVWDTIHTVPATYDDPIVPYDSPTSVYDSTADGEVQTQRYEGYVVGIEAQAHTGQVQTWRISTVGVLSRWGVTPVKVTAPSQTDVARMQALWFAAGPSLPDVFEIHGPPGVTLAAATIDTDLRSAMHEVCASSGGLLWQGRNGDIHYTTAGYRQSNQSPDFAVAAGVLVDLVEWDQQVEDIINQVVVEYGPTTARAELTVDDLDSQSEAWGLRSASITTQVAAEADAEALGALIVARRGNPYWRSINALAVLDPTTETLFAAADVNTVVMLPIPRDPGPTPTADPSPWVVEGWVEEWTEGLEHTAALAVSDQRRWVTTTLRTYTETLAMGTYADVLNGNTYLDVLVKEA